MSVAAGRRTDLASSGVADDTTTNVIRTVARVVRELFSLAPGASAISLVSFVVDGLFPAAQALLLTRLFDSAGSYAAGEEAAMQRVTTFAIGFIACFAVKQMVHVVSGVARDAGVYERSRFLGRMRVAEKAAKLPLAAYEDPCMLDIRQRADDCVENFIFGDIYYSCSSIVMGSIGVVSITVVLAGYDPLFVLISIVSVVPNLIMRIVRGKQFYRTTVKQAKKNRRLSYLWELLTRREGVKELRATGCDEYLAHAWRTVRDETLEERWDLQRREAFSLIWCDALKMAGYGASLALAFSLVVNGSITVGLFGACISAFLSLQSQMKSLLIGFGSMGEKAAYAGNYFTFLSLPEEIDGACAYAEVGFDARASLVVDNVSFRYPGTDRLAIDGACLHIRPGEKLAVLGENGSGKTTLAKLLLGLYIPDEGSVRYGGVDVGAFERASFMRTVSIIAQDYMVYKLTLRENAALSDVDHLDDPDAVRAVLESVGLSDVLERCGLDGRIGREFGGTELSGGEGQRLAIARGVFRESDLVVLDEPTSALDPLIEAEVLTRFMNIVEGKTAVVISHRVGLCRLVDRIAVMRDGCVVECDSHSELLAKGGEYARLYAAQEQWYR